MFDVLKLYKSHPLHLLSFDFIDNKLVMVIINDKKEMVQKIKVSFFNAEYFVECNSAERVLNLSISNLFIESSFVEPKIISYFVEDEEKILDYSIECEIITQKKSLSKLGDEKYIFRKKLAPIIGMEEKRIKFEPEDLKSFWICACGATNLESQEECLSCSTKKEDLFSSEIDYSKEEYEKRHTFVSNFFILTLSIPIYVMYFILVFLIFNKDPLFSNELAFSALGNLILYSSMLAFPAFTGAICYFKKKYIKIGYSTFEWLRFILVVLINALLIIRFVHYSYLFFPVVLFDIYYIYYFINNIIKKVVKVYEYVSLSLICVTLITSLSEFVILKKYNMKMNNDGISLVCTSNEDVYKIPNTIDGEKVTYITFDLDRNYSKIKEIVIPENTKKIYINSSYVLPSLEKITLSSNNKYFYLHNDILFENEGKMISLVPQKMESVVVDWDKVTNSSFRECRSLKNVTITSSCKAIGDKAFYNCTSLSNFEIQGDELKSLGSNVFSYCTSLEKLSIPDCVDSIGESILENTYSLKDLTLPFLGIKRYEDRITPNRNGLGFSFGSDCRLNQYPWLKLERVEITSQKIWENAAFYACPAKEVIVNSIDGNISGNFLYGSKVEEFVVKEGIVNIETSAFANCKNLKKITLPSTLKTIGVNAFNGCSSLEEVEVGTLNFDDVIVENGNDILKKALNKNV